MINKRNSKSKKIRRIETITLASILLLVLVCIAAASAPTLNFIYPTPANNSYQTVDFAQINISIGEQNLDTFKLNWNATDYTFYDNSLVLAMNLNNNSAIGENAMHAVDISPYKNNGTLVNGPAWTSSGRFGSALNFDGSNDYVDCGTDSSLNISNGSWELWLKFGAKPSVAGHPMNPLTKQEQYWIHASDDDSIQAKISVGGTRYIVTTGANFIETGVWYHVAGTYDGETLKLYVNGELKDSNTDPSGNLDTTDAIIAIGTWSSPMHYFQGTIDEVRIYKRSLSATEIWIHYLSEFKKHDSTQWYFCDNVTDIPDGMHTYYGWANDTTGASAQTEARILYVNANPPGAAISQPANQTTVAGINATYELKVTNTANIADTFSLAVTKYDDVDVAELNETSLTDLYAGASWNVTLNVSDSQPGKYNVTVNVTSARSGEEIVNTSYIMTEITPTSTPTPTPTPPPTEVPAITPPGFLLALISLFGLAAVAMKSVYKR